MKICRVDYKIFFIEIGAKIPHLCLATVEIRLFSGFSC